MSFCIREEKKYAVACITSMGVRITPPDRMAVHNSDLFRLQATSAETNVLNITSSLGHECLALTKFVKGSPIAEFNHLRMRLYCLYRQYRRIFSHKKNTLCRSILLNLPLVYSIKYGVDTISRVGIVRNRTLSTMSERVGLFLPKRSFLPK